MTFSFRAGIIPRGDVAVIKVPWCQVARCANRSKHWVWMCGWMARSGSLCSAQRTLPLSSATAVDCRDAKVPTSRIPLPVTAISFPSQLSCGEPLSRFISLGKRTTVASLPHARLLHALCSRSAGRYPGSRGGWDTLLSHGQYHPTVPTSSAYNSNCVPFPVFFIGLHLGLHSDLSWVCPSHQSYRTPAALC